jgi:hypothetical protein
MNNKLKQEKIHLEEKGGTKKKKVITHKDKSNANLTKPEYGITIPS